MSRLSPALRAWIAPGRAGTIAVVDAQGLPQIVRIWAVRAVDDDDVLEVYVQASGARRVLAALDRPRRAALNLIEIASYRSRAYKGICERSESAPDEGFLDTWIAAFHREFHAVGLPPDAPPRMLAHGGDPAMAVLRLTVETVFDQSPKPGAGARL